MVRLKVKLLASEKSRLLAYKLMVCILEMEGACEICSSHPIQPTQPGQSCIHLP